MKSYGLKNFWLKKKLAPNNVLGPNKFFRKKKWGTRTNLVEIGTVTLRYFSYGQISPGQMSLVQLESVQDCTKILPLKFGSKQHLRLKKF